MDYQTASLPLKQKETLSDRYIPCRSAFEKSNTLLFDKQDNYTWEDNNSMQIDDKEEHSR